MNAEFLLEAVGQIDDELVEDAQESARSSRPVLTRWLGMAAAVVLCAGLLSWWGRGGGGAPGDLWSGAKPSADKEIPYGSTIGDTDGNATAAPSSPAPAPDPSIAGSPPCTDPSPPLTDPGCSGDMSGVTEPSGDPAPAPGTLGERVEALPEGSREVGTQPHPEDETAICPLWQAPDGRLFLQLPEGGWAEWITPEEQERE